MRIPRDGRFKFARDLSQEEKDQLALFPTGWIQTRDNLLVPDWYQPLEVLSPGLRKLSVFAMSLDIPHQGFITYVRKHGQVIEGYINGKSIHRIHPLYGIHYMSKQEILNVLGDIRHF